MPQSTVAAHRPARATRVTAADKWLAGRIRQRLGRAPLRLSLWDGTTVEGPAPAGRATLVIRDRATLYRLVSHPDLHFGEAFMHGTLEVVGDDLSDALTALYRGLAEQPPSRTGSALAWLRHWVERANSVHRARENVHRHYDLGNDFYRQWLDEELLYTCAYYPEEDYTLERAQRAKMELVCRKLRLRPGERVVEAGCGWGAFARYMAREYGVQVTAYNISREQVRHARAETVKAGLTSRVTIIEDDYRAITGQFDAFVSLGMLEHVGTRQFGALGRVIDRALVRPGGRGLLHFIGRNRVAPLNPWIRRRIFPGAYPPTLAEVFSHVLSPHDFSVTDVENLRPHYARTLADWRGRFDRASRHLARVFDEDFVRAWRLYLAGSEAAFRTGSLELFQVAFTRGGDPDVPHSREGLYANPFN